MKKEVVFAAGAAFIFMTLSAITYAYEVESNEKLSLISEDKIDVSGDGKKDTILLKGVPYEEDTKFLKEIQLEINASNGKSYEVKLEPGYSPAVQYVDLNQDGMTDLFISIDSGGSGGISYYHLYTLKDFKLLDLSVPDPLVINSQFLNGYKASITIEETGQSYTFDLRNRADEYEQLGLYQNRKLSEPMELMVDPYSTLKPIQMKDKTYGLIGIQAVSGANHEDRIALVEATWNYENGKWVLKNIKVLETSNGKQKRKK